jgi:hypothetical protein
MHHSTGRAFASLAQLLSFLAAVARISGHPTMIDMLHP